MAISISKHSYASAIKYYYTNKADFKSTMNSDFQLSQSFKDSKGQTVTKSLSWFEHRGGVNSCALRVSYALWGSGLRFDSAKCSRFIGTFNNQKVILPSVAVEYKDILGGEFSLKEFGQNVTPESLQQRLRKTCGVILFSGGMTGATGHVTFCDNGSCADGEGDKYFTYPSAVYFWPMKR